MKTQKYRKRNMHNKVKRKKITNKITNKKRNKYTNKKRNKRGGSYFADSSKKIIWYYLRHYFKYLIYDTIDNGNFLSLPSNHYFFIFNSEVSPYNDPKTIVKTSEFMGMAYMDNNTGVSCRDFIIKINNMIDISVDYIVKMKLLPLRYPEKNNYNNYSKNSKLLYVNFMFPLFFLINIFSIFGWNYPIIKISYSIEGFLQIENICGSYFNFLRYFKSYLKHVRALHDYNKRHSSEYAKLVQDDSFDKLIEEIYSQFGIVDVESYNNKIIQLPVKKDELTEAYNKLLDSSKEGFKTFYDYYTRSGVTGNLGKLFVNDDSNNIRFEECKTKLDSIFKNVKKLLDGTQTEQMPPIETEQEQMPPIETEQELMPPIETEQEQMPPIETEQYVPAE
jgi:hypothetical protein